MEMPGRCTDTSRRVLEHRAISASLSTPYDKISLPPTAMECNDVHCSTPLSNISIVHVDSSPAFLGPFKPVQFRFSSYMVLFLINASLNATAAVGSLKNSA